MRVESRRNIEETRREVRREGREKDETGEIGCGERERESREWILKADFLCF